MSKVQILRIDRKTAEVTNEGYKKRTSILKNSGSDVSTHSFPNPEYSNISGILYSTATLWNLPQFTGQDFLFVNNSVATNPIEIGMWNVKYEYYRKGGSLFVKSR
ncbi:MAG: hypothetical protein PVI99_08395 [Anaerolineales bacterium]